MFKAFYAVLKPGGVLGVVDHRAADGRHAGFGESSGYLPTSYVVKLATDAGFKLDGQQRDQRQSERHQGLSERRVDVAAHADAGRSGSRPSIWRSANPIA
jgi:hypothetical protein